MTAAHAPKTDRNDARGIAQLPRMGWYRPVHCKSQPSQDVRALLTARKQLLVKAINVEWCLRGLLRGYGLKMGQTSSVRFAARVRELAAGHPALEPLGETMLCARDVLRKEVAAQPHSRSHRAGAIRCYGRYPVSRSSPASVLSFEGSRTDYGGETNKGVKVQGVRQNNFGRRRGRYFIAKLGA